MYRGEVPPRGVSLRNQRAIPDEKQSVEIRALIHRKRGEANCKNSDNARHPRTSPQQVMSRCVESYIDLTSRAAKPAFLNLHLYSERLPKQFQDMLLICV